MIIRYRNLVRYIFISAVTVWFFGCSSPNQRKVKYNIMESVVTSCDSMVLRNFEFTQFVNYDFFYNGVSWNGSYKFKFPKIFAKLSPFQKGDSIKIAFDKTNPSNNYLYQRKFKHFDYYMFVK